MGKANFKGALGLAEMYCDKNKKRRAKNISKFLDNLQKYAVKVFVKEVERK
jgi:hypothetical protein